MKERKSFAEQIRGSHWLGGIINNCVGPSTQTDPSNKRQLVFCGEGRNENCPHQQGEYTLWDAAKAETPGEPSFAPMWPGQPATFPLCDIYQYVGIGLLRLPLKKPLKR